MASNNNVRKRKLKTIMKDNDYWLRETERYKTMNIVVNI